MRTNQTNRELHEHIDGHLWIGAKKDWATTCESFSEGLVPLPGQSLSTHALIIGASGSGKSCLLHHLIAQDILRGQSIVVLDARGDMAGAVLELSARAEVDPTKIKFFNLREKDYAIGFNPLHGGGEPYYRALSVLDAVAAESDSWGVQIAETLRNAVLLLAEVKGALTWLEAIFFEPSFRRKLVAKASSENVKAFWHRYDDLSAEKQSALALPVLNKVSILFATEPLRRLFGHQSPADISKQLNTPGSITLVSLAVDELHSAGWMTGSLFLSAVCREIFSRVEIAEKDRNPVRLYVDEFEHFGMRDFESILAEGRRFKFSAVLAHQTLAQLSPKMRSMILGNVGVKVVFRTARQDADTLNKDLTGDAKAFDLPSLPIGECVLWRRGSQPQHIEVNAPLIHNVGERSFAAECLLHDLKRQAEPYVEELFPSVRMPAPDQFESQTNTNLEDWI